MTMQLSIDLIKDAQYSSVLEIFRVFVDNTRITFAYSSPGIESFSRYIAETTERYPWLVCCHGDKVVGYAYGSEHRKREGYLWSVETSIYISHEYQGKGIGKALYGALIEVLRLQGFRTVVAGVAVPNDASEKLHRSLGFSKLGEFKKIGYKAGEWVDVVWFQLNINPYSPNPPKPVPITQFKDDPRIKNVLDRIQPMLP